MKDMKEALSSGRKADTTHVRRHFQIYTARMCEWGSVKYERANYLRPPGPAKKTCDSPMARSFERYRGYLRAARDHIDDVLQAMEKHQSTDPLLENDAGMRAAAYAVDTDEKPGCQFGASHAPHVAPACASLMMAIEQAVMYGLLPADFGTPWEGNRQHREKRGEAGIEWPEWIRSAPRETELINDGPVILRKVEEPKQELVPCRLGNDCKGLYCDQELEYVYSDEDFKFDRVRCKTCLGTGRISLPNPGLTAGNIFVDCGHCNGRGWSE